MSEKIVKEIEDLEGQMQTISQKLEGLKVKAATGQKISADELNITVQDIDRLNTMMRDRRDVGH